jgi:hypothetical protein
MEASLLDAILQDWFSLSSHVPGVVGFEGRISSSSKLKRDKTAFNCIFLYRTLLCYDLIMYPQSMIAAAAVMIDCQSLLQMPCRDSYTCAL